MVKALINQRTFMHNPWTWTRIWGLAWGGVRAELSGGGKGRKSGNNCNT